MGWGKEVQKGMDICMFMADSHCWIAETNITFGKAIILPLKVHLKERKAEKENATHSYFWKYLSYLDVCATASWSFQIKAEPISSNTF